MVNSCARETPLDKPVASTGMRCVEWGICPLRPRFYQPTPGLYYSSEH